MQIDKNNISPYRVRKILNLLEKVGYALSSKSKINSPDIYSKKCIRKHVVFLNLKNLLAIMATLNIYNKLK